jgi:hypothetical protein
MWWQIKAVIDAGAVLCWLCALRVSIILYHYPLYVRQQHLAQTQQLRDLPACLNLLLYRRCASCRSASTLAAYT